jgi:hypothetical protein
LNRQGELPAVVRLDRFRISKRMLAQVAFLEERVKRSASARNEALRNLLASREVAVPAAQREFYLEFSWLDQEYRANVSCLARFCHEHPGAQRR